MIKGKSTDSALKSHNELLNYQSKRPSLLLIDDDKSILKLLEEFFKDEYNISTAKSVESALDILLKNDEIDLIISDINLPNKSGLDLVEDINQLGLNKPIILITAHGKIDNAALALKKGAVDYITKPLNFTELEVVTKRAIRNSNLEKSYEKLKYIVEKKSRDEKIIGSSSSIRKVLALTDKIADCSSNVLILGETGVGKEVIASRIHNKSARADNEFVAINCSSIPKDLLESELFGYKKGAFTGADTDRKGLLEKAEGGTLFLDEIGDMPMDLQAKILRIIQERNFRPIGGTESKEIDVRIITATHKDLKKEIKKNNFRSDLFFRLCVLPIYVPPLRERREDIPLLAAYFLKMYNNENDTNVSGFTKKAIKKLEDHPWPGNIRELKNIIERAVVLNYSQLIEEEDLELEPVKEKDDTKDKLYSFYKENFTLQDLENVYIKYVLDKTNEKEEAANRLGINRRTLYRKIKKDDLH